MTGIHVFKIEFDHTRPVVLGTDAEFAKQQYKQAVKSRLYHEIQLLRDNRQVAYHYANY